MSTMHPGVAEIIRGRGENARDYDVDTYRSFASIPISIPGREQPLGVLVATSDVVGRFIQDGGEDALDTVEVLRALGNALATLLVAYNLRDSAQGDSDGKND
jgi:GAF domain-containing protein